MTAGRCSPEQYDFYRDLEQTVFPMLDLLRISNLNRRQTQILDAITDSLNFICQRPQFGKLINSKGDFTRREMQIVNLIFQGKTTKEISDILVLSPRTVDFHRANIRKKFGIKNLGGDLQRWLAAMEREEEPLSAAGSAETNGDLAGRI
jgi:DNA-binding CsgD family transcriptional regulator